MTALPLRPILSLGLGLGLALALGLGLDPARVAADVGVAAPRVEAREWVSSKPLAWADLDGQVVLLFFLDSRTKASKDAARDLAEVHKQSGWRGVAAIAVTDETKEQALALAKEVGGSYAIAIDRDAATRRAYRVVGLPQAVVVDRDGVVVHEGPAGDRVRLADAVEDALRRKWMGPWRRASAALAAALAAIDRDDPKAAIAELLAARKRSDATDRDRADAAILLGTLEVKGEERLRRAEGHAEAGEWAEAARLADEVAARFDGLRAGQRAANLVKAWRSVASTRREIAAGEALLAALELDGQGRTREAIKQLRRIVQKYPGTKAAERAEARLAELTPKK